MVSVEKTLMVNAERKGLKKGIEQGRAEGLVKGIEKGEEQGVRKVARNLKENRVPVSLIMQSTGLSEKEIEEL